MATTHAERSRIIASVVETMPNLPVVVVLAVAARTLELADTATGIDCGSHRPGPDVHSGTRSGMAGRSTEG